VSEPEYTVENFGAYIPISCCQLTDAGLGTCEHPPAPKPPFWRRVRWEAAEWWHAHWPRVHFGPCNHDDCGWS